MSTEFKPAEPAPCCEFADCMEPASVYHEDLQAWLCSKHEDSPENSTGYCSRSCMLGNGCDESC